MWCYKRFLIKRGPRVEIGFRTSDLGIPFVIYNKALSVCLSVY